MSSLRYDSYACQDLKTLRDQTAARYGLAAEDPRQGESQFREKATTAGYGMLIPDLRSKQEREQSMAAGEVEAMNDSLKRRKCLP